LFLALAAALFLPSCGSDNGTGSDPNGQLVIEDITVGTGATLAVGDTATVQYVGAFTNGQVFDSGSFSFRVGAGSVIQGFDQGVVGMKVGGKRRITVPPNLGYGSQGNPPTIPGNTTLVFEVTLVSIAGK
jgi:FKBP-type peptidyl-prolyl cis-trans isomerase